MFWNCSDFKHSALIMPWWGYLKILYFCWAFNYKNMYFPTLNCCTNFKFWTFTSAMNQNYSIGLYFICQFWNQWPNRKGSFRYLIQYRLEPVASTPRSSRKVCLTDPLYSILKRFKVCFNKSLGTLLILLQPRSRHLS